MSKEKKPKKLRRPNLATPEATSGTGAEGNRAADARPLARGEFDYSYVRKDLKRIGVLAGSFIAVLITLSFFIR
jgi:hypothetical protein